MFPSFGVEIPNIDIDGNGLKPIVNEIDNPYAGKNSNMMRF